MRISPVVILLASVFAFGHQVAAQAIQQTVQVNQTTMQGVGNAARPAILAARPAAQQPGAQSQRGVQYIGEAPPAPPDCGCAKMPVYSVEAGELAPGTQVTIASPTQDATIFYTTDGWTPTASSTRYTGPITITADTRLQAIAQESQKLPSPVVQARYRVRGSMDSVPQDVLAAGGTLLKGTTLHLVTDAEETSDSAQVGDSIPLLLAENIKVGDTVVVPKGTPVDAKITKVERAGHAGKPGVLEFQVHSFSVHGITVPLDAYLRLEGSDNGLRSHTVSTSLVQQVSGALPPGNEADIEPGMPLTASVAADTPLHP